MTDRRALLAAERGTLIKQAETRVALVYPSPYRAAMSSLGYQQIYRALHALPGVAADRAMLPEDDARGGGFVTLETGQPVGGYPMLAYSVAYELEIAGVVETLARAGIPALRGGARRTPSDRRRRWTAHVLEPCPARAVLRCHHRRRRRGADRRAGGDRARDGL